MKSGGAAFRAALVAAGVVILDQIAKALIRHDLVPGEISSAVGPMDFTYVQNHGVAFGFAGGGGVGIVVVTVAILVILGVAFVRNKDRVLIWLPTGLIAGGAIGNLIDRVRIGSVTDFVKFPHWPAFNIADISITVGVIVFAVILMREPVGRDETVADPEPTSATETSPEPDA